MLRALQPDMRDIEKLAKKEVKGNLLLFAVTCALIRYIPKLLRKIF
ncbi:uncharacterized protein LOC117188622 [Drosophila miranda]|nr:uncharacterized protein LOC117188622 [Drosophila miranda]